MVTFFLIYLLIVGLRLVFSLCESCEVRLRVCLSREDVHLLPSGPRESFRFRGNGRQNNGPRYFPHSNPWNLSVLTLHGIKNFEDLN